MGEVAVREVESNRVVIWKMEWLTHGGFSKRNAELIATSKVDYRYAIDVLNSAKQKGYDEDFVIKLIL